MATQQPARPTADFVQKYIEQIERNSQFSSEQKALSKLLAAFPLNQHLEDVILKTSAINSIYNTRILDIYRVAQHIFELQIDPQLESKSPEVVDKIALVAFEGGKQIRFYSFATKYCSIHNPEAYPIFDSFVEWLIDSYRELDGFAAFSRNDLRDYPRYKEIIESFKAYYGLTQFNFKQLDKFLWRYGQQLRPRKVA